MLKIAVVDDEHIVAAQTERCLTEACNELQLSNSIRNLVVASTEKGAMTTVGFEDSICTGANTWTEYFFKFLSEGKNYTFVE